LLADLRRLLTDQTLLNLIKDPNTPWQTLEVLYEEPRVERVWMPIGENRLNIQRIYPCTRSPFIHPHPWPCAILLLKNRYRMNVAYGSPFGPMPRIAATIEMVAGGSYEMLDPNGWHDVSPTDGPVLSLMLTGPVWTKRQTLTAAQKSSNQPLSDAVRQGLLAEVLELIKCERLEPPAPLALEGSLPVL
jgi:hypothetical protein